MDDSFSKLCISPALQQVLTDLKYAVMTPIQAQSIPLLLQGRDIIGQSRTGSGKTAAFAIAILEKIETHTRNIQALVVVPTRELCQQVAREVRRLGRYRKDLRVVVLSGGHPVYHDKRAMEHGAHLLVGTPGRLLDHLKRGSIDLSAIRSVVLDEADRMLDMGFRDSIEAILAKTPSTRQTLFFSATFPTTIEALSRRYQRSPERVIVETPATDLPEIEQLLYRAREDEKPGALIAILKNRSFESVLVFCNQKYRVDDTVRELCRAGFSADRLHGDLEQPVRERVMAKFRNHSTRVLVATDVAARGIDIVGLDAVVNFDLPRDPEQYVHRIGRTGRAGCTGIAISLVTPYEEAKVRRIAEAIRLELPVRNLSAINPSATQRAAQKVETPSDVPGISPVVRETISISAGRKHKLRAGDILGALTGDVGLKGTQVGKIEILDRVSFVAVDSKVFGMALARLQAGKIKGRRFLVQRVS